MEQIRTFIAIELTEEILRSLREIQKRLQDTPAERYVRWVRPGGIHLTLKFLGNVPASRIEAITEGMQRACVGIEPFSLDVGELGCFPNPRRPRVIWVGVQEDTGQLARLQRAIEDEMKALGYPPEKRAFHPHLTLARTRKGTRSREQEELGRLIRDIVVGKLGRMQVERVSLMRSDLQPGGAVYTELAVAEFIAP